MASCWKRKFIRLKRVIRVVFMVLICALLGLTFWGPFTYQHIIKWLPLHVIKNLSQLTKAISQVATCHVVHLGIIGYAFHRLPKKNQYARQSVKKKKVAAISVSAVLILLEAAALFGIGGYLFYIRPSVADEINSRMWHEISTILSADSQSLAPNYNPQYPNQTLMYYAVDHYSCCGVESQPNCSVAHVPLDKCFRGSQQCRNGCLDAVMFSDVLPYIHTIGSVAFIIGAFATVELGLEIRKIGKTIIQEGYS